MKKMQEFRLFNTLRDKFESRTDCLVNHFGEAFSDVLEKFDRPKLRALIEGYVKMRASVNKLEYSETKLAESDLLVPFTWLKNIFLSLENYLDMALDKLISKHDSYEMTFTEIIYPEAPAPGNLKNFNLQKLFNKRKTQTNLPHQNLNASFIDPQTIEREINKMSLNMSLDNIDLSKLAEATLTPDPTEPQRIKKQLPISELIFSGDLTRVDGYDLASYLVMSADITTNILNNYEKI